MVSHKIIIKVVNFAAYLSGPKGPGHEKIEDKGEIINNQTVMELLEKESVGAFFPNLRLKNFKREERKQKQCVLEEKTYLLFKTEIRMARMTLPIWTLSLPIVPVVHGNQECLAQATVMWHNNFAEVGKFQAPGAVTFGEITSMLNMKWKKQCHTNRGLSDCNILYLASKLFQDNLYGKEISGLYITWTQFSLKYLPGRNFSFWEWVWNLMKLTRKYFSDAWEAGYILGFASKDDVKEILNSVNYVPGTFILRFSDSLKTGGLTLAYKTHILDAITGQNKLIMAEPFHSKILDKRSLADTLLDQQSILTFVHTAQGPVPLKMAFQREATTTSNNTSGYVKVNLRVVVGKYL